MAAAYTLLTKQTAADAWLQTRFSLRSTGGVALKAAEAACTMYLVPYAYLIQKVTAPGDPSVISAVACRRPNVVHFPCSRGLVFGLGSPFNSLVGLAVSLWAVLLAFDSLLLGFVAQIQVTFEPSLPAGRGPSVRRVCAGRVGIVERCGFAGTRVQLSSRASIHPSIHP
jgi:hypothetical protein